MNMSTNAELDFACAVYIHALTQVITVKHAYQRTSRLGQITYALIAGCTPLNFIPNVRNRHNMPVIRCGNQRIIYKCSLPLTQTADVFKSSVKIQVSRFFRRTVDVVIGRAFTTNDVWCFFRSEQETVNKFFCKLGLCLVTIIVITDNTVVIRQILDLVSPFPQIVHLSRVK